MWYYQSKRTCAIKENLKKPSKECKAKGIYEYYVNSRIYVHVSSAGKTRVFKPSRYAFIIHHHSLLLLTWIRLLYGYLYLQYQPALVVLMGIMILAILMTMNVRYPSLLLFNALLPPLLTLPYFTLL